MSLVNVRVTGRDFGLEALAASILSLGVLQPLVVVPGDAGFHYVVDGNRRLAALESLLAEGKLTADAEVPVIVRDAGASAVPDGDLVPHVGTPGGPPTGRTRATPLSARTSLIRVPA